MSYRPVITTFPALSQANTWTAQQNFTGTVAGGTGVIGQKLINATDADQWTWFQSGSTTDYRDYLYFAPYDGSTSGVNGGWLMGRNAQDVFIIFGKKDATHRFWADPSTQSSSTFINSVGSGGVHINQGPDTTNGTGGLIVYTGGNPSTACTKNDISGVTIYQGALNINRYAGASGVSGSAHVTLYSDTGQNAFVACGITGTSYWNAGLQAASNAWSIFNYNLGAYALNVRYTDNTIGINASSGLGGQLGIVPFNRATKGLAINAAATLTATINNVALTSNVATLTTTAAHGFTTGETVVNSGLTNTAFNGTFTITGTPTTTSYTFALTHADVASTPDSGTATDSQSANYLQISDANANALFSVQQNGIVTILNPTDGQEAFNIDSGLTAAQNSVVQFRDRGTSKWQIGKDSSNNFRIFDLANSKQMLLIAPSTGNITPLDGANLILGTTTGMKFGTATTQKLGFFNATPVVQQATTGTATGFTAGAGTTVTDQSTFTGGSGSTAYRISDIVLALKNLGLIAA